MRENPTSWAGCLRLLGYFRYFRPALPIPLKQQQLCEPPPAARARSHPAPRRFQQTQGHLSPTTGSQGCALRMLPAPGAVPYRRRHSKRAINEPPRCLWCATAVTHRRCPPRVHPGQVGSLSSSGTGFCLKPGEGSGAVAELQVQEVLGNFSLPSILLLGTGRQGGFSAHVPPSMSFQMELRWLSGPITSSPRFDQTKISSTGSAGCWEVRTERAQPWLQVWGCFTWMEPTYP